MNSEQVVDKWPWLYSKRDKFSIPAPLQEEKIPKKQVQKSNESLRWSLVCGADPISQPNDTLLELGIPSESVSPERTAEQKEVIPPTQ